MTDVDVLVVGAGPTGLALALQAAAHGATVRIVERREGPFRPSRAMIMHIRTLEVLHPLGVTGRLLDRAAAHPRMHLHAGARDVAIELTDLDLPDTPYPHLTLLRQMDVESVLADALADRGIDVERGTELVAVGTNGAAEVILRSTAGDERVACTFVAGCDGVASTVRQSAGIGWHSGDYRQEIILADLELTGLDGESAHVSIGGHGLAFLFPLGEGARWRLLATREAGRSPDRGRYDRPVAPGELDELIINARLPATVSRVAWSTLIRPRHGLAAAYRRGPVYLAGDAAHVHSPAGGQGMNTGIQDAINLGWKLAYAGFSSRTDLLLDSYQRERRPVARLVRLLTDVAFWVEAGADPVVTLARRVLAPYGIGMLPALLGRPRLSAEGVRMLSQLRLSYRASPLSSRWRGGRGRFRAGDRLPDQPVMTASGPARLHELIGHPGADILVARDGPPGAGLSGPRARVHRILSWPGSGLVGVRPDGYVGVATAVADIGMVRRWTAAIGAG